MDGRRKKKITEFLKAAVFLMICAALFVLFTYVFRNLTKNQRLNILSYYNEERETIDVVAIGASSMYRYWDPMRAYETEGLTSFTYSCANMHGSMARAAIEDVLSSQQPKLILIDGKRWLSEKISAARPRIRYYTDSLDIGPLRFRTISYYCRNYDISVDDSIPLFLDLCLYHNHTAAIASPSNWALWNNRLHSQLENYVKGFGITGKVKALKPYSDILTSECADIDEKTERLFRELMDYCRGLDAQVMIVVTPYKTTREQMEDFNTLESIAAEYGIPFWNGNRYYEEMGVDFNTDFYSPNHMNVKGAQKMTDYLLSYLKSRYDLPDHRGEEGYEAWEDTLATYRKKRDKALKKIEKTLQKISDS